jgi:hypothetical protein
MDKYVVSVSDTAYIESVYGPFDSMAAADAFARNNNFKKAMSSFRGLTTRVRVYSRLGERGWIEGDEPTCPTAP